MKQTTKIALTTFLIFVLVVFAGAWLILKCEGYDPHADIKTYSDALWWTVNICSVGDAGFAPVTTSGRVVSTIMIVIGYALFTINVGMISAIISHMIKHEQ